MNIELKAGERLSITFGDEHLLVLAVTERTGLRVHRKVACAAVPPFDTDECGVVRVRLGGTCGRLYAYRCPGAKVGDLVRIRTGEYHRVEALGDGGYCGPLKDAELVTER